MNKLIGFLLLLPSIALAQVPPPFSLAKKTVVCGPKEVIFSSLSKSFEEEPIMTFNNEEIIVTITYSQSKGTMSVVEVIKDMACVVSSGILESKHIDPRNNP
jgi:hypothetical protein